MKRFISFTVALLLVLSSFGVVLAEGLTFPSIMTQDRSQELSDALNAEGCSNTFISEGAYPWVVDNTTYPDRTTAKSGNTDADGTSSVVSTTITLTDSAVLNFDYFIST